MLLFLVSVRLLRSQREWHWGNKILPFSHFFPSTCSRNAFPHSRVTLSALSCCAYARTISLRDGFTAASTAPRATRWMRWPLEGQRWTPWFSFSFLTMSALQKKGRHVTCVTKWCPNNGANYTRKFFCFPKDVG